MTEIAPGPDLAPGLDPAPGPGTPASQRGGIWLGILLVAVGCGWLLSALGLIDLDVQTAVALVLIGIGAVIALDAGRSHGVLVTLAVILSLAGAAATWVDVDVGLFEGGIGDRSVAPATVAEAAAGYDLGIGKLTLDLTGLPSAHGLSAAPVRAQVGVGQIYVTVPQNARVVLDAHVSIGNVNALGTNHGGFDVNETTLLPGIGRTIALKAEVGIGEVVVARAP
jgi:hypothetical protein